MDIGKQRRVIEVEPRRTTPAPQPAPSEPARPEPAPERRPEPVRD